MLGVAAMACSQPTAPSRSGMGGLWVGATPGGVVVELGVYASEVQEAVHGCVSLGAAPRHRPYDRDTFAALGSLSHDGTLSMQGAPGAPVWALHGTVEGGALTGSMAGAGTADMVALERVGPWQHRPGQCPATVRP